MWWWQIPHIDRVLFCMVTRMLAVLCQNHRDINLLHFLHAGIHIYQNHKDDTRVHAGIPCVSASWFQKFSSAWVLHVFVSSEWDLHVFGPSQKRVNALVCASWTQISYCVRVRWYMYVCSLVCMWVVLENILMKTLWFFVYQCKTFLMHKTARYIYIYTYIIPPLCAYVYICIYMYTYI